MNVRLNAYSWETIKTNPSVGLSGGIVSCSGFSANNRFLKIAKSTRYDFFKQNLLGKQMPFSYQFKDGILVHSLASVSAGFVATST